MRLRSPHLAFVALICLAAPVAAADGPSGSATTDVDQARKHFERGAELYKENSFDAALAEFSRAYELVPNYRVLYNIGQVQVERHDYVAALRAFEDYLRQGAADVSADRREQVERDIANLRTRVSELQVKSNVAGAQLSLDGVVVGELPLKAPLLVSAGVRRLTLSKQGYATTEHTISVAGGDSPEVSLVLEPLEAPLESRAGSPSDSASSSRGLGTGAWVSLVATGVFAGSALTFGLLARGKNHDLDRELDRFPADRGSVDDTRSSLKLYAGLTDGFTIAAGASAVLAAYFIISGSGHAESRPATAPAARLIPLKNGVALRGTF